MLEEKRVRGPGGGLAIVTGGSSGIGKACAALLIDRGHPVALLARGAGRLAEARTDLLSARPDAIVITIPVDVGDQQACQIAIDQLIDANGAPEWVICSAGIAKPGLFLEQPLEDHTCQLRTNYLGSVHVVRTAAPAMAGARKGRIVLISSGAAFLGIYGYSAYAPSKFAVRALAEVLRVELSQCGVSVTVACPPDTLTPQLEAETLSKPEVTRKITSGGGVWAAHDVAKAIIDGASRGRFFVGPGWSIRLLCIFHSVLATFFRLRQVRMVRHELKSRHAGERRKRQ